MTRIAEGARLSLYRTGGMALLVAGSLYVLLIPVVLAVFAWGKPPNSSDGLLQQIISTPALPRVNAVVFTVIDLSTLVGFAVLMLVLRKVDRAWPIVALAAIAVAVVYDMQDGFIEWAMTRSYAGYPTAPPVLQSAYRHNTEFIYQYIYKVVSPFIAIMVGLGVGLVSLTMRRGGVFPQWIAYLGLTVAAVSIIGGLTTLFPLLLSVGLWYIAGGVQLLRRATPGGTDPAVTRPCPETTT